MVGVERTGGALRIVVVAEGQRLGRREAADGHRIDAALRAAAQGDIGLAGADQAHGIADGLGRGGAGRGGRAGRAVEAEADRHLACREIGKERGNDEGGEPARSFRAHQFARRSDRRNAADAGADLCRGARPLSGIFRVPAGMVQRLDGRGHGILDEQVVPPPVARIHAALGVEAVRILCDGGNQPGDAAFPSARVEAGVGNDAALPCGQPAPVRLDAGAQRGHGS